MCIRSSKDADYVYCIGNKSLRMEGSRSMVAKYEHFDDPSVIDRTEIRYVQREEPRAVPSRVNTNIYQQ